MLKKSERAWLKDRKRREEIGRLFCIKWCPLSCSEDYNPCLAFHPSIKDFRSAAEFEARVAAKLAGILDRTLRSRDYTLYADCTRVCPAATDCTKNNWLGLDCAPYLLKWARLAVEEEMDNADSQV